MAATRLEYVPEAIRAEFGVTVSEQGRTTTICLRGEWDLAQRRAIRELIGQVLECAPECVVLDLARLAFMDSTGVHGVIELQKRCAQQEVRLVILPGPRAVQRIFELLGLTDQLPFLADGAGRGRREIPQRKSSATEPGGFLSPPAATPANERSDGRRL